MIALAKDIRKKRRQKCALKFADGPRDEESGVLSGIDWSKLKLVAADKLHAMRRHAGPLGLSFMPARPTMTAMAAPDQLISSTVAPREEDREHVATAARAAVEQAAAPPLRFKQNTDPPGKANRETSPPGSALAERATGQQADSPKSNLGFVASMSTTMKSTLALLFVILGLSLWSLLGGGSPATESPSAPLATNVRAESAKPALNLDVARLEQLGIESPERITAMPIQDIRVGMRVPAMNPEVDDLDWIEEQVDPATWKKVTMICPRADGSETEVTFLRSPEWIRESIRLASGDVIDSVDDRLIGKSIEVVIPEIALSGMARIVAVDDCPAISNGPGEIVTGTFATDRAAVLDLEFHGLSDTLGVTAEHPIWSETREDFVPAGQLEIGEEVLALNGETTYLSSITPRAGPEQVYNFEVANEHVYFVTRDGLLVNNAFYFARLFHDEKVISTFGKKAAKAADSIKSPSRLAHKGNAGTRFYDAFYKGRHIEYKSDNFSKWARASFAKTKDARLKAMSRQLARDARIRNADPSVLIHWHFNHDPSKVGDMTRLLDFMKRHGISWGHGPKPGF